MAQAEREKAAQLAAVRAQLQSMGLDVVELPKQGAEGVTGKQDALVVGLYADGRTVHETLAFEDVKDVVEGWRNSGANVFAIPVDALRDAVESHGADAQGTTVEIDNVKSLCQNAVESATRAELAGQSTTAAMSNVEARFSALESRLAAVESAKVASA